MRVRLTVTGCLLARIESPRPGSVEREAGENPARTRHCDRGSPPHAVVATAGHWSRTAGPGRRGEGGAREPGDLPPTTKPTQPSWKGVASPHVRPPSRRPP